MELLEWFYDVCSIEDLRRVMKINDFNARLERRKLIVQLQNKNQDYSKGYLQYLESLPVTKLVSLLVTIEIKEVL